MFWNCGVFILPLELLLPVELMNGLLGVVLDWKFIGVVVVVDDAPEVVVMNGFERG